MDTGDYIFGFIVVSLTMMLAFYSIDRSNEYTKMVEEREILLSEVLKVEEISYDQEHDFYFTEDGLFKAKFNEENTKVISYKKVLGLVNEDWELEEDKP